MGLTKRDREFLTILHEARFIDGKLMRKYEQEVKKHLSFSDEELQGFIEKFLAEGLLTKIILKVDGDDVMYLLSDKVGDDLLVPKLRDLGVNSLHPLTIS